MAGPGPGFLVARRSPGFRRRAGVHGTRRRRAPRTGRMGAPRGRRGELGCRLHRLDGALRAPGRASIPLDRGPLWLPFYLLMLGGLASLMRAERRRVPPAAWLDALIPACAVSAVISQLLMPHVETAGKPLTEQVVLLAYPALDVCLIVAIVLVLALRRWEPDPRWGLLAVAVLGSALGDLLWSYLVASGSHEVGSPADLPYVLTAVAIACAAWAPKTDPLARSDDDRLTLLLPGVAAGCALGLLFYGAITGDLIVPVAPAGAGGAERRGHPVAPRRAPRGAGRGAAGRGGRARPQGGAAGRGGRSGQPRGGDLRPRAGHEPRRGDGRGDPARRARRGARAGPRRHRAHRPRRLGRPHGGRRPSAARPRGSRRRGADRGQRRWVSAPASRARTGPGACSRWPTRGRGSLATTT